jgi:hypothetical protein
MITGQLDSVSSEAGNKFMVREGTHEKHWGYKMRK